MANVNANVNVIVNTQQAQAQLRLLTTEINNFNKQSFAANSAAARQQKALNQALIDGVRTSGQFSTSIVPITSAVDRFSDSLERGKLSLGQYTRYAASQLPGMRKVLTKEFDMINNLAEDRVKRLNTQFVRIGQSANGMQQALAMMPNSLDQFSARSAIAMQRQQIFNRMLRDGSTQLLNWGKNTQWAGRQLMVGFTIPLGILGAQAAKIFKELEAEAISFKKVYGDMFTSGAEVEENLSAIKELSVEMTKYGQSVQQTMQLANTAAQSGARGAELLAATTQATRLAVLGQMEQAQAIETTISLQTSFALSNEELAESINFLNSVENQTILSLQDVSEAIPRVASVIKGFGGDVEDLSVLLVAMKEGGVSAAEGANALKNSMARIISPTKNALEVSAKYGIALQDIVNRNDGKVVPLFQELAKALEAVGGQPRQEILSAVFGKFQYARIGTLLSNIAKDGSQAAKAIELTGLEARDLAATAEKELSTVENAVSTKFTASLEKAKLALAPVGEEFLKALTPVLDVVGKILGKFDELPGGLKTVIVAATAVIGGIAPIVLMVTGLVANGIANIAKFIMFLRKQIGTLRGNGEQFKMYSKAELDAAAASSSLEGKTTSLTRSLLLQRPAIEGLITLYERLAASARIAAASMPATMGMPRVPTRSGAAFAASMPRLPVVKRNAGGPIFSKNGTTVPGVGNTDKVPAMLTPGEFVINKKATQNNLPLIKAINDGGLRSKEKSKMPKSLAEGIQYANIGLLMQGLRRVSGQIRPTSPSGKIFPKWFFDTRTGTNRARQKQALEDSYYLGTRFKKEDGSDYSLQEIISLSDNKVKELWKGIHRGHMAPSVAIGGDKDYLPGILAPMMGGGKGGNLSMIRGGNPKEIYDMFSSMESRGIHPMSILFGASKELGYNASSSVFMKTYEDLMQSLLSKKTNFGGKESFESWAYRILKRNLGKIENKNGNFFEKMNYVGTVRGINPQRSKSADGGYSSGRGSLFTAMLPEFNKGGMIPGGQVNDQRNFYGRFNAKTIQMFTDWVSAQSSKTAAMKSGVMKDAAMASTFRGGFRKSGSAETLRRATWMEKIPEVGETLSLGALSSFSPKGVPVRQHLANSPIQQNAEFAASRLATLEKQQKNDSWRLKKLRDPDAHPNTKMWANNYVSVLDRSKVGQEAAIDDLMWAMNNRKSEIAKYKKDLNIYKKNTPVIVEIETPKGTVRANIDDIVSLENQMYMGKNTFESERILHNPIIKVTGIFDDDKKVKVIKGKLISSEYPGFNAGGTIPGVGNTDKVPAMLTPGEFVINKQSTKRNLPLIQAINNGEEVAGFNKGGMIPGYSMGGRIAQQMMGRQSVKMLKANKGAMVPGYNRGGMVAGVQRLAGGAQVAAMARVAQSQRRMARPKTLMDIDENAYNRSFSSIMRQSDIEDQASQTIFSSFNIRKNDQGYIFKGYGEEIPTAVMGKNKVLGITPQELLQEALLYRPNDKKLLSMLNNFNNKKYGKNETRLLDEIAASISIDKRGRMSQNEDTAGYAHVLSSLMGDQDATRLVSLKRKSLYSELDKIKQIKQKEARANPQDTDATWDDKVFIHSTARGVNIDKKGNALIYSAGDATRGTPDSVPRSTVHTTINAPVESHMGGQWGNENQLIVGNAKKVLSSNNSPSILNVTDTAFPLSPGQPLRIPNASVVTPVSDAEKYKKLLMEKKLISNDGNTPPFIINDDKSNDVLYFIKKEGTYTDDDRIAILRDTGYPAKPKDIVGRETDILKDEALTRAMRQQKVEGRPQKLGQWGTSNPSFDQGVYRLAAQKGLSGGIHQGSPSQLLEMSAIDNRSYYSSQKTPNRFGNADIHSIRHVVASGHSKTNQREVRSFSRLDDDYVTLNKGGFVPQTLRMNRGNIVPGMGNKDTVPALLTPGESVINKKATSQYRPLIDAINSGNVAQLQGGYPQSGQKATFAHLMNPTKLSNSMSDMIRQLLPNNKAIQGTTGRLTGYSNFGAYLPEKANQGKMSPSELKKLFNDPKQVDRIMRPMYKAIASGMYGSDSAKSVAKVMKDPEIKRQVREVASRWGTSIGNLTTDVVKDKQLYKAIRQTTTKDLPIAQKAINAMKTPTTVAAAGGRQNIPVSVQKQIMPRLSNVGGGLTSYTADYRNRPALVSPSPMANTVPKTYTQANSIQSQARQIMRNNPGVSSAQALNMARIQAMGGGGGGTRTPVGGTAMPPGGGRGPVFLGMPGSSGNKVPKQSAYSRLNSGIGKVGMGAGMALSMASMMPMMGADEQGKWMGMDASTAMMGMMGGGMLLSIAPMLGAAAAPILGLAAAAAAAGLVFKGWRESLDESARKAAEFGSNIGGAANAAENMANILGMEDLQSQRNRTRMSVAPEEEEQFLQFSTYLEGEAGKALINSLKNLTSADKFKKVADYLRTAIASGMLDKQQATTFAKAVGANLNDTLLANNLVSNILREGVSVGSKSMLGLAQKREEEVLLNKRIQNVLQSKEPDSVNSADAAMTISASMQIIKSFQDALAVAEQEQRDGVITFQEYLDVVNATKFATQQWTDAMLKASTNTDDAGATAQGTELALKAAGVTQEQLDAYKQVSETVNIGGQAFENDTKDTMGMTKVVSFGEEELRIRSGTLADLFLMNSVAEAGYGQDYEKFAAESDPQVFEKTFRDAISAQKSVEEITGVGTTRNPIYEAMIQAVEGGLMESGDATALVQQILSDPLGEAAKSFKEGGMSAQALADSLIAANADIDLAAAGIPESVQGMYQDISKQLPPAQAADFANYIAGITSPLKKEKAIRDFSAIGKGMGATGQQQVRTGFLNTGIIANQAGWSQQAVDKLRSSSQYQEALSATSRSTKYAGSSGMAIEFDPEKLERINDALAEAAEIGVSENVISFVLREVDDSEGKIDLAKKTKEMTGYVKDLAALPDEIKIALNIDTTDGEDVERFGPDAEQLQKSWGLLSNLNPNINLMLAARFLLYDNEGNLRDPMDTARKINALNAAWKNLSSKDPDVVKQARFNIAISYAGNELGKNPADVANAAIEKLQNDFKNIGRWSPQAQEIALQTYVSSEVEGLDEAIQLANLEKELVTATGANRTAILMAMKKIQDRQKTARENAKAYVKSLDKNIGSGSTGGGGGQESPLKSFLRGILDQINMWVDASAKIGDLNKAKNSFVNQVLKGAGIFNKLNNINAINPVRLQEILGMGPEGANDFIKKYIKKGKITKEGRNVLDAATAGGAAQTIGENTISKKISNMQIDAANVARDFGASNEAIQSIAGDPKKAAELLRIQKDVKNGVEGAIKAKRKFIQSEEKAIKRAKELQEALKSPIEKAIDKQTKTMEVVGAYFDNEYAKIDESMQKEFEGQYGMSAAQMELEIKKREDVIDTYRDEIDVINEAIRAIETRTSTSSKYSEWGLEQLQKEIESNQTLISQYERQNELDQRRIETLQRQDELRNRESEALSYELDAMSQIEDKIRESYGKRLEALDKIAQVNDYILDQERQKLGLSKAISEGDIYAATAAAQEMRQGQAEFSQNQMRSGLEQGMENAVEGLRTSTGLTRDQAEERINQIKEQSYQTSLLIRDIEDKIYNNNLNNIIPLKDKEYNLNLGIKSVQDQIAIKQNEIKVIEETRIAPLEKINKNQAEALNDLALQTEVAQAAVEYEGLRKDQWDRLNNVIVAANNYAKEFSNDTIDARDNALSLANAWREVSKQIDNARKAKTDQIKILDVAQGKELEKKKANPKYENDSFNYKEELEKINKKYKEDINAILEKAPTTLQSANKGGVINKYSIGGNVLGSGSRDSVIARLTPGEYVIRKAMVDKYGIPMLSALNQGSFAVPKYNMSSPNSNQISVKSENNANIVAPMYNNYSVNVSVSNSGASADEIANKTLMKIKQLQSTQIRSGRGY